MENNIDQLAQKIYKEGIEKANEEAKKLLEETQEKSDQIIKEAKQKADLIISQAEKEAEGLKRNSLSEIKLGGEQAISALKQKIQGLLSEKILTTNINEAFEDPKFLKSLILEVVKEWESETGINLTLSKNLQEKIDTSFEKSLVSHIKDLEIKFDTKLKGGFKVSQEGKAFQITFSDEDFVEFFSPFLRQKVKQILFN